MDVLRVEDWIRSSKFIFLGTPERLRAATLPIVPVTDGTAVVKVDEVYRAPAVLGDLSKQSITVQLNGDQEVQLNKQVVFFTNGWLYGDNIAVVEVGHLEVGEDHSKIRDQVSARLRHYSDEELIARIDQADLIVVALVIGMAAAGPARPARVTEHSPDWWEAQLEIQSVDKGAIGEKVVTLLYPNSRDVMWFRAPKPQPGQQGIWFLKRMRIPELDAEAFTALDPLDVHPGEPVELERLRSLIRGTH
jgi:hypothetical protein